MANDANNFSFPARSEQTPLLERPPNDGFRGSNLRAIKHISPAILVIPIAVASRLSGQLPATTFLQILQKVVCKLWYEQNDPSSIPRNGRIPESCARPEIDHNYAATVSLFEVIEGVGVTAACSAASYFASRYGRKPTMLTAFIAVIIGYTLVIISDFATTATVEALLLGLSMAFQAVSSSLVTGFIANMYIVDVSTVEERTIALSTINGWWTFGGAISYTLGGLLTTKSDGSMLVYLVAIAMLALSCIYIVFILPESFPEEKRAELRLQRFASKRAASEPRPRSSALWRAMAALTIPFEPIKKLSPQRKWNGKYNWRLVYCAAHVLITQIGNRYAHIALVIYYTTRYSYSPAQVGYMLSTLFLSSVFTLTTIIPLVVRLMRPFYKRHTIIVGQADAIPPAKEVVETSGNLELHIVFGSWILATLSVIFAASASTFPWQLFAVMCVGMSTGHVPVFRSVVAASAEPLMQGEILAAVEMVASVGITLSPIIMGTILTMTIATLPQLVFYVHGVIVILGAFILFFIRDSDRYQISASNN
ncbi:MFS general substrate transporter [Hygrophoropsis aurantiaca]|uniref:MFS general substrate transporter n=1 Tax=Hygrophoropsis aurantiaca TaxID=72124 RepID=A0ACB8A7Q1_9AGAM|nr:MFS general substrate transporter [Hygrophoropsis aurantiaca]